MDPTTPSAGGPPGSETVPPTGLPPGDPTPWDPGAGEPSPKRRVPLLGKVGIGLAIVLVVAIVAGFLIHVPYSTISPGEAVSLPPLVTVDGAKTFSSSRGDIRLLFVRERNNVSVWRYVQAHFDPDVDIVKDKVLNPQGRSQQQLNGEAQQQMADAKTAATVVALSAAGFKVTAAPGLTVSDLEVGLPAE
jgi:PDZ domain-containing secreted protein